MDFTEELKKTARSLVAPGKGILAADESLGNIGKKFTALGIEDTPDKHRDYREMLFTAPNISKYISGVILFDETIKQKSAAGVPLPQVLSEQGIIPGIKVDMGTVPLPGSPEETTTEGLDTLPSRLPEYYEMGARFAKWRGVIHIKGKEIPSQRAIVENAERLAEYAKLCQENGLVPIVEPEVLMDGDNGIDRDEEVTTNVLKTVFAKLKEKGVMMEGMLLKPNMVCPGLQSPVQSTPGEVAEATARVLLACVPAEVPGIVFLSGGQTEQQATQNLNLIVRLDKNYPWALTFSYGRALQNSAMKAWGGDPDKVEDGKREFAHRARMNSLAQQGKYEPEMEQEKFM